MSKVNYFIETMQLSPKDQRVGITFKRIPTQEQIQRSTDVKKKFNKWKKENIPQLFGGLGIFAEIDHDMHLNFGEVQFIMTLKEIEDMDLRVGKIVTLDIPESIVDIQLLEEKGT